MQLSTICHSLLMRGWSEPLLIAHCWKYRATAHIIIITHKCEIRPEDRRLASRDLPSDDKW